MAITGEASLTTPSEEVQSSSIFVNDVSSLDCAVFDPETGITGQTWRIDINLSGSLGENGFVYDFGKLKTLVRQILDNTLDHALLIPVGSQYVSYSDAGSEELWQLRATSKLNHIDFEWSYKCPKGAVFPVRTVALKPNTVAQELARLIRHRLPSSIPSLNINFRQDLVENEESTFRYTHSIPGHEGYCQRIFHGHRSVLEVYLGTERRRDLERFAVKDIFGVNVHFATPRQLKKGPTDLGVKSKSTEPVTLVVEGSMGKYEAVLPANRVFLVEPEASIECVAKQVATLLRAKVNTQLPLKVICFEGVGKGAIAEI